MLVLFVCFAHKLPFNVIKLLKIGKWNLLIEKKENSTIYVSHRKIENERVMSFMCGFQ